MATSRTSLGCVETRVVSRSTRLQLFLPDLALAAAIAVVGLGSVVLRANARGDLRWMLILLAMIGPVVILVSFVAMNDGMRSRNEFARFQLALEDRRKLSLPDMKPAPSVWNGGSYFALRCEGDRPQLAKGMTTLEISRLELIPTVLLTERGKVVGVDLARGDVVLRKRAGGPTRFAAAKADHA